MKRVIPTIALGLGLLCANLPAQGRNFAGSWTVDVERTMAANPAGVAGGRGGGGGMRSGGGGGGGTVTPITGGAVAGARGGGGGGVGGGMRSGGAGPVPMSITADANTFTVTSGETTTNYRLDGQSATISTPRGGQATVKASWQGDRVVIETTNQGPEGPLVTTATWYMEGDALVRETNAPGPNGESISRKTYFKRS